MTQEYCFGRGGRHAFISSSGGVEIQVDSHQLQDLLQFTWLIGPNGYPVRYLPRSEGGGHEALHRRVARAQPGDVVDHADGDLLNATRANLRITDALGNARNKTMTRRLRRGEFKGVYLVRKSGRWAASIGAGERRPNGRAKMVHLGCFDTPEEAAKAYDRAAREMFGAFAATNLPQEVA